MNSFLNGLRPRSRPPPARIGVRAGGRGGGAAAFRRGCNRRLALDDFAKALLTNNRLLYAARSWRML